MISRRRFFWGIVFRFSAFYTGVALGHLLVTPAQAADDKTCTVYALDVANVVSALTHDADVAMAAQDRAYAYCIVIDYPPDVKLHDPEAAPAKVEKANATVDDSWARECAKQYRTFRPSDGTVIRYSSKRRVICPLPK